MRGAAVLSLVAFGGAAYAALGVIAGVVGGLFGAAQVALVASAAVYVRYGNDEEHMLRLERGAHPRFFCLLDDICAAVGAAPLEAIYLGGDDSSANARVESRSCVVLGLAALCVYDVTALRSTVGHELGHVLARDTSDDWALAYGELRLLSSVALLRWAPIGRLASRLIGWATPDAMRRSRLNEHAADFWGGLAAGPGTTLGCLLQDKRARLLWESFAADVHVLQAAGFRLDDLFSTFRDVVCVANADGFNTMPSMCETDPGSTHPAEKARVAHAEAKLAHLPLRQYQRTEAAEFLEHFGSIAHDLTELSYDPGG